MRRLVDSAPSPSTLPQREPPRGPWGFWATGVWGLVAFVMRLLGELFGGIAFLPMFRNSVPFTADRAQYESQIVERATVLGAWVGTILMLVVLQVAIIQRQGLGFSEYLAVRRFPARLLVWWVPIFVAVSWVMERLAWLGGDHSAGVVVHEMADSGVPLLFMLAGDGIATPVGEELLFRGFLYRGLAASRVGTIGAILIPNLFFALAHDQYDGLALFAIFANGCIYGLARHFSGSVVLPMVLHALNNVWFAYDVSVARVLNSQ